MQTTEQSTALSIFRRNIRAETSPTTTTLTQFPVLSSFDCHMRCCCSSDWMRQVISASDRTLSISVSSINWLTNSCGWCGAALQLRPLSPVGRRAARGCNYNKAWWAECFVCDCTLWAAAGVWRSPWPSWLGTTHTHTYVSDRMSCDFIDNLSRNRILWNPMLIM